MEQTENLRLHMTATEFSDLNARRESNGRGLERAMPYDIKTDADLLRRLRAAAGKSLSQEELRAQRLSFILGNLPKDSTVTRDEVERMLDQIDGEKADA